jgi:Holliday junction resolvasome RuvABC endonuclease subunit
MPLIVGIDPSYTCTGIVALDEQCKLICSKKVRLSPGPGRLLRAGKALHGFIVQSAIVGLIVLEDAAYGAPSRITVARLKELSGVYKFVCEAHDIPVLEISPSKAKAFIAGKGNADKHVVAQELARLYGLSFPDDNGFDLSDAASLAVWGVKHGHQT